MGGGETRSRQTTTTTLPAGQQRNVDQLLSGALDYFQSGGRQFYDGDLVANFNPNQVSGQQNLLDFSGGVGRDLVSNAIAANNTFLDPNVIFNPDQLPGFSGVVDDFTRGYTDNLLEQVLPSIRAGATASGQFGGSASGIGEALAVDRTGQSLADGLSQLYLGAYGQGLDSFNQAQNRIPSLFQLGLQPGQIQNAVGGQQQQQAQDEISADAARFEFEQNEPIFLLNLLRDLTGSYGQYGGTQQTNASQETASSPVNQVLGGALSLASLWNPATSLFGGMLRGAGGVSGPALQAIRAGVS